MPDDVLDDLTVLADIATRPRTRAELEAEHGRIWDEQEVSEEFTITAIIPPTIIARRHADRMVGTLLLQPRPRLYFRFRPTPDQLLTLKYTPRSPPHGDLWME